MGHSEPPKRFERPSGVPLVEANGDLREAVLEVLRNAARHGTKTGRRLGSLRCLRACTVRGRRRSKGAVKQGQIEKNTNKHLLNLKIKPQT